MIHLRQRMADQTNAPKGWCIETQIAALDKLLADKHVSVCDEAQTLFWDAMEAPTDDEEIVLLQEVFNLDPGNLDAIMVMMQHHPVKRADEIAVLRRLVALGEQRIGRDEFDAMRGEFWGFLETRPYMRARHQLAAALRDCDRLDEAHAEWEAMLALNPGDNQGVRFELLSGYFARRRTEDAAKLLDRYASSCDYNVVFAWGRVLSRYLTGTLPEATQALNAARRQNPHAEDFANGKARLPRSLPEWYEAGSMEEARCYAKRLRSMWKPYAQARQWLSEQEAANEVE